MAYAQHGILSHEDCFSSTHITHIHVCIYMCVHVYLYVRTYEHMYIFFTTASQIMASSAWNEHACIYGYTHIFSDMNIGQHAIAQKCPDTGSLYSLMSQAHGTTQDTSTRQSKTHAHTHTNIHNTPLPKSLLTASVHDLRHSLSTKYKTHSHTHTTHTHAKSL